MFYEISPEEEKCYHKLFIICVYILNVVSLQQTKSTTFCLFVCLLVTSVFENEEQSRKFLAFLKSKSFCISKGFRVLNKLNSNKYLFQADLRRVGERNSYELFA